MPAHASRAALLTELGARPPAASSEEAGEPLIDEDYLILPTIHSAKGQEWKSVHVLNVVDGCMPADMASGHDTATVNAAGRAGRVLGE
ncbi:MAG: hypothetical protein U1F25_12760 [Rubrivivax sp.]